MKILICGSRSARQFSTDPNFPEESEGWFIASVLCDMGICPQDHILLGGAQGTDEIARQWAEESIVPYTVIRPVNPAIKSHYLYRNVEMIALCDKVIAFWDGKSTGTKFVIDYAKARNKPVTVIPI